MNKIEIFKIIYEHHKFGEEFLDSIPWQIRDGYFDNPYVESINAIKNHLLREVFTVDELFVIEWFLYDMMCRGGTVYSPDGEQFEIASFDEYIEYLKKYEGWE